MHDATALTDVGSEKFSLFRDFHVKLKRREKHGLAVFSFYVLVLDFKTLLN